MNLKGKVVIVTGGGNGIGEALSRRFAAEKPRALAVVDLEKENAERVAHEIGGIGYGVDVTDEVALKSMVCDMEDRFGEIDLLFSNAGIGVFEGPEGFLGPEGSNDAFEKSWAVNVMAHVYGARAVLPGMLRRGEGYICSTASAAGLLNQIGSASYGTTKHAAIGFAENVAITYGDQGIKVSVLCPQAVRTRMIGDTDGGPAGQDGILSAEEVAECTVKGLEKESFLILPHEEVLVYSQRKANDYDRWIKGMQRFRKSLMASAQ